ncbi:MAG: cell wall metabolism sensor histidine kinase WalK, partial [Acidaminococcales bacterium]|nr:cell wall metabolism sensor histidine kinase WalK [Acidaminococcales bacterium]
GEKFFFAAIPLGKPPFKTVLRVSSPDTMSGTVIGDFLRSMLAAFLLLIIPVTLASSHLAGRLLRPLKKITEAATELSLGHLEHRVDYRNYDEFTLLAHTLNKLAGGLSFKIKELSSEKQNQQLILEHMDNPIIVTDNAGRIVSINNRGRYVFHHNRNTCLIGSHNLEVVGSSLLDSTIKECLKTTEDATIDLKITRNRIDYIFRVFISPMPSSPRPADSNILCVFHDVTALLGIYERQISFVANASHELSTPLTSIVGFSETLLDGAIDSPPLSRKFVGIIHEESVRMQKIIKDILQLARLDSGEYRQAIAISAFSAKGFMEKAKKRLRQQIARKKLSVHIIYKQPPGRVLANADWLEQILLNLLENAVKYSHDGGNITITYDQTSRFAVFAVSDEGVGIKAEQLPFIFERFYRAGKAAARKRTSGTGLGLAIVKFIVDLFGGTITAESNFNVGSTFIVNIPLASYEDETEPGAIA